jgi:hypothetical protein
MLTQITVEEAHGFKIDQIQAITGGLVEKYSRIHIKVTNPYEEVTNVDWYWVKLVVFATYLGKAWCC